MRRLLTMVFVLGVGCASNQAIRPSSPPAETALSAVLRLEVEVEPAEDPGTRLQMHFHLRNVSDEIVSFCQVDGGVSIWDVSEGVAFPLVLNGMVFDAGCYEPTTLRPREARDITEAVSLRRRDRATRLDSQIRLQRPGGSVCRIMAEPIEVAARPANSALQPTDAAAPAADR
jgi:hypothetical protein